MVRPGSCRAATLVLALLAAGTGLAAGLWITASGGSAPPTTSGSSLPSWLPTSIIPVGRVVTASPAHPWLAIEGDSVRVTLPGGTALATAVGPAVPEEGQFPVPATTACTFTVTLAPRGGSLPLSASAFSITDEEGHVHQPVVTALGEGAPPARLDGTHPVTLTISSVLPTGNGTLHWAPTGHKAVVSWDFDVEID